MRSSILGIHICAGVVGLLSGVAAMSFRKGSRRHGLAGNVFVVAMLVMGSTASYLSVLKGQSGLGGLFACYLVITAWSTARRRSGETNVFDWGALMFALAFGVLSMMGVAQAARSPTGSLNGVPAGMILFLGSIALLAAAGDIRMLVRGLSNTERIARHLWRMCFALFIATGSFLAQKRVFTFLYSTRLKANRNGTLTLGASDTKGMCCNACARGRTNPYMLKYTNRRRR